MRLNQVPPNLIGMRLMPGKIGFRMIPKQKMMFTQNAC